MNLPMFSTYSRRLFLLCLSCAVSLSVSDVAFGQSVKTGHFKFDQWDGPALNIYYAEPDTLKPDAPIVLVMHGASRNADDYRDNWIDLAEHYGFAVYAPEFDKKRFRGSKNYNLGGLTKDKDRAFDAIEPLFKHVKTRRDAKQDEYYLFGHSAGGQFVHRYAFFGKHKNLKLALAANSGWYTTPTTHYKYPYGLGGLKKSRYDVEDIIRLPLMILLGDQDTDPESYNLRHTQAADAQGLNRYDRGINFLKLGNLMTKQRRINPRWSYNIVPGVAHDNRGMAVAAAAAINEHHVKARD